MGDDFPNFIHMFEKGVMISWYVISYVPTGAMKIGEGPR